MKNHPLIWKGSTLGIILLFLVVGIVPSTAQPLLPTVRPEPHPGGLFGLYSNIAITWNANETEKPIVPRGELRTVLLDLSFWVTSGVFGRLINTLYAGRLVTMNISIIHKPEWCTATLAQSKITLFIPKGYIVTASDFIAVQVAENAPAFETFPVTIQATIEPLHGLFGFFTIMQGTTQVVNVTFTVGYKPLIKTSLPEGNIIETPPLIQVDLPIGITNLGNGKTIVENKVVNYPSNWTLTLPAQLVFEVNEYKEMNLSIIAPLNFSNEKSITISFTPHSFDNYSLVGPTYYVSIVAYYRPPK